jgi:8-oxo-dGTP pyrophosphatase MutT (NUDIX family)
MYTELINTLQKELHKELPGIKAQNIMAPNIRHTNDIIPNKKTCKESGVLILLYQKDNAIYIPFIQRPLYNGFHSGQISLPGGKMEPFDIDLRQTALRETYEEIGVNSNEIEIIGELSSLFIPNSNFNVSPFVGYIKHTPFFTPDPIEVESIIEAPLQQFLSDNYIDYFERHINQHQVKAPYFNISNHQIWGATAMIISELKQIILSTINPFTASNSYNAHNVQGSH